jgi:hypothetical protein
LVRKQLKLKGYFLNEKLYLKENDITKCTIKYAAFRENRRVKKKTEKMQKLSN